MANVKQCGFDNPALFAVGYGTGGPTETLRFSELDLDETDRIVVAHDQIDFTKAATIVSSQHSQALPDQVIPGIALELRSLARCCAHLLLVLICRELLRIWRLNQPGSTFLISGHEQGAPHPAIFIHRQLTSVVQY